MNGAERDLGRLNSRFAEKNRRRDVWAFSGVIDAQLLQLHPIDRIGLLRREVHQGFDAYYQRDLRGNAPSFMVTENGHGDFAEYGISNIDFMFTLDGSRSIKRTILFQKPKTFGESALCSRVLSEEEMENLLHLMIIPEIHTVDQLLKGIIDLNPHELSIVRSKDLFVSEMVLKAPQAPRW